jgi:xanthine/uracil/vitamin C permease (AzgA family)
LVSIDQISEGEILTPIGIKRDLTTATAAISGIATIAFGFLTNLPVALA